MNGTEHTSETSGFFPAGGTERIASRSLEDTQAVAARLAEDCPDGTVICLHGDLGAGKTCFVKGLARALGIRRPVGSPTFTLVNEYRGARRLAHIDLYRIRGAADAFSLGLEDYLRYYPGLVAIEWAERALDFLPEDAWHVRLTQGGQTNERILEIARPMRSA